jgi:hypothetical protein
MPDFDHDPVEESLLRLRDLAAAGREHARGLPAEQVRALGARRHRRRIAATAAAASLTVGVFAGAAVAVTGQLVSSTTPPQPVDVPPPGLVQAPPASQNDPAARTRTRRSGEQPEGTGTKGKSTRESDRRTGGSRPQPAHAPAPVPSPKPAAPTKPTEPPEPTPVETTPTEPTPTEPTPTEPTPTGGPTSEPPDPAQPTTEEPLSPTTSPPSDPGTS